MIVASCRAAPDTRVQATRHADGYSVIFHTGRLEGQCYAPGAIRYDGALDLSGFVAVDHWRVVQNEPVPLAEMNRVLSARRERIGDTATLAVPRDSILVRPFYVDFPVFPCDAPARAQAWRAVPLTVLVAADLPPFYPPGSREKRSPEDKRFLEANPMMENEPADDKSRRSR